MKEQTEIKKIETSRLPTVFSLKSMNFVNLIAIFGLISIAADRLVHINIVCISFAFISV